MVLVMGEGGAKQALVDLGSLPHEVLHGLALPPGLLGQGLERDTIILSLLPEGLRRGFEQAPGKLEGLLLKREGVLHGRPVGFLGGLEDLLEILLLPLAVHHLYQLLFLLPLSHTGLHLKHQYDGTTRSLMPQAQIALLLVRKQHQKGSRQTPFLALALPDTKVYQSTTLRSRNSLLQLRRDSASIANPLGDRATRRVAP